MYSGTTFNKHSGRIGGVHQRIDRIARRSIERYVGSPVVFPSIREIIHFEGINGPDGIKRKSPGVDEPWHYIDPKSPDGSPLLVMINDHIHNLTVALKEQNKERAAFEAAWMAHAITDGLTPAHHYPLEEKLEELRDGKGLETRTTKKERLVIPGKSRRHQLMNNWEFWGAKGVMTTHINFELGVATTITAYNFGLIEIDDTKVEQVPDFSVIFLQSLRAVADMNMYEEFSRSGWNRHLAHETRKVLIPEIVRAIMYGWLYAVNRAGDEP